jgi:hypothetical protein
MAVAEAESRWLLRGFGRVIIAASIVVAVLGLVLGWPAATMGNAFQLLGLALAALGIPILSQALARVELRVSSAKHAIVRWILKARNRVKHLAARVLRRRRDATVHAVAAMGSASAGGDSALAITARGDPGKADMRTLLIRHDREIVELHDRVDGLERTQTKDRAAARADIDALRTELQEHVLSVTREGWHYIAGGAAITAAGIVVALFG